MRKKGKKLTPDEILRAAIRKSVRQFLRELDKHVRDLTRGKDLI